jgi:WD40 repeat protein
VWNLGQLEDTAFQTVLPVQGTLQEVKKPDILYELELNTMNFCAFAHCRDSMTVPTSPESRTEEMPMFLAVPHILDSEAIDVFQLPSTSRLTTIPAPKSTNMGMVMALDIHTTTNEVVVVAGYESGHAIVWTHPAKYAVAAAGDRSRPPLFNETWTKLYECKPHTQPVLSLVLSPDKAYFITTSADSILAKHPLKELFEQEIINAQDPLKTVQTKHSGQQGVSMRSDGKVYATAGWDARVRVYSGRTMKEVAVLKWHKDGCYATSFAYVRGDNLEGSMPSKQDENMETVLAPTRPGANTSSEITTVQAPVSASEVNPRPSTNFVASQRAQQSRDTHWLAVGAKDGKVSLWDVF